VTINNHRWNSFGSLLHVPQLEVITSYQRENRNFFLLCSFMGTNPTMIFNVAALCHGPIRQNLEKHILFQGALVHGM
jgi:hypothetical protein